MKLEHWIIITGPTLVLLIALMAIAPDEYWDIESSTITVNTGPAADADILTHNLPNQRPTESFGGVVNMLPSQSSGRNAQQPNGLMFQVARRQTIKPQPGLMNFEQAPRVRFSGVVQQVSEFQKRDGQIHIWIHDTNGGEREVSIGPSWFLKYIGCQIGHDINVSGVGFSFDNVGPDPLIYARKIKVNGKTCRLRNDEGFALWSSRLR